MWELACQRAVEALKESVQPILENPLQAHSWPVIVPPLIPFIEPHMNPPNARFTEGSLPRHVLAMASASGVGLLAVFLVDILTLVYVSRLADPRLMAAVGLGKALMFVNGAFSSGVIIAAGALLSQRIGRHATHVLARLVTHLLIMVILVSTVVCALELLCMAPLSRWFGADPGAYEQAHLYIWMTLVTSIPAAAMQMCAQLLRSQGHGQLALVVLLSGAAALAVADPLFIFGFNLGLQGAGLAYGLSTALSLTVGLVLVKRRLGLAATVMLRRLLLHTCRVTRVAVPAMLANLAMPVGITYLMVTLAAQGASALAGMAVVDRLLQLGYCMYFALPTALVPVLAQNLGAGRDDRARLAVSFTAKLVVLYGVALWSLLALSGQSLADAFHLEGAGRSMLLAFCHVGAGLWIVFGLDFVAQSLFFTLERAWWVPAFGWLRGTLGSLPFVYVGAHWQGGSGALFGLWLGNALVALMAIFTALFVAQRVFRGRAAARAPVSGILCQ